MSTQYITSIGLNYNVWDFTWRESDCAELVPNFILNGTKVAQFSNLKDMNYM